MAGAIDLKSGSSTLSGTNLFSADKNPLNQLDGGTQDVIGQQAGSVASSISSVMGVPISWINSLLDGLGLESLTLANSDTSGSDASSWITDSSDFLDQLMAELGFGSNTGTSSGTTFAGIVTDATNFIDSLLAELGFPVNSGTSSGTSVGGTINTTNQFLVNLLSDLGLPTSLASSTDLSDFLQGLGSALAQESLDNWYDFITGTSGTGHTNTELNAVLDNIPLVGPLLAAITGHPLDNTTVTGVYVANYGGTTVADLNVTTSVQTSAAFSTLHGAVGLAMDSSGNLYVSNSTTNTVYKITPSGTQTTLGFSALNQPNGLAVDSNGNVYVANKGGNGVFKLTPGGTQTTMNFTDLVEPMGVAVDASDNVYATSYGTNQAFKCTQAGVQTTLPFTTALSSPVGIAVDEGGDIYVANQGNATVYKLTPQGTTQTTLPFTGLSQPAMLAVDYNGTVYVTNAGSNTVVELTVGGVQTTVGFSGLNQPYGIVLVETTTSGSNVTNLSQLQTWFNDLVGNVNSAYQNWDELFTALGIDVTTASDIADLLTGNVSNTTFQQLIDGVSGGQNNDLQTFINDLVYGIGTVDPSRITHVPISAIGDGNPTPNLILNGQYNGQGSIATTIDWEWDPNTDHTGLTGSGAAMTTANGSNLILESNPIAVTSGQQLSFSAFTKWSGLTSSGSPIWLGLETFLAGQAVTTSVIQAVSAPAASGGWTELSGSYTAPSGIDTLRVTVNVGSTATAGTVWFDDVTAIKSGLMQLWWMNGLTEGQTLAQDFQSTVDNIYNAVFGGSTSGNAVSSIQTAISKTVTDFDTLLTNLFSGLGGSGTASSSAVNTLLNDFFGSSGTMATLFTSLFGSSSSPTTSSKVLQSAVQNLETDLSNAWTALFGSSSTPTTSSKVSAASVTNVLGGSNLSADLTALANGLFGSPSSSGTVQASALSAALQSANTYWNTLMSNLFGGSTPASTITTGAVPTGISPTKLSSLFGGATLSADLTNLATALFGGTTVTSSSKVGTTSISNIFGGATLSADLTNLANALFGTTSVTNTSKVGATSITSVLSQGSLGADLQALGTMLFGSATVGSTIAPTKISNLFGGSTLSADLTNLATALFGGTTVTNTSKVNATSLTSVLSQGSLGADLQALGTMLFGSATVGSAIAPTKISNLFGGATLSADLTNLATALFGGTTVTNTSKVAPASVSNVLGNSNLGADLTALSTALFGGTSVTSGSQILQTSIQNLENIWNNIFGSGNSPTTSAVAASSIAPITIGSVTASIESHVQSIVDGIAQAINGGTGTGNSPNSIIQNLQSIPQNNVAVTNAAASTTVALLAHGAGSSNTGTGQVSTSWTDTIPAGANYALAVVHCSVTETNQNSSCYLSNTTEFFGMTPLASLAYGGGSPVITIFGLLNPPTGAVTYEAISDESLSIVTLIAGTSLSFSGVGGVQDITPSHTGSNGNPSLATSFTSPALVVNALGTFGTVGNNVGLSAYNKTQAYHSGAVTESLYSNDLIVGTVTSPSDPSFSATVASTGSTEYFGALAIALNPSTTASVIGSGFRAFHSGTSGVSSASGNNPFGTFFNSVQYNTEDMTLNSGTGVLTINYTGSYSVTIHVTEAAVLTPHFARPILYQNGTIIRVGPTLTVTEYAAGTFAFGFTWNVYCPAGSTLQPGYWSSQNVSSAYIGDAAGTLSFWEVALTNRSLM